MSSARDTDPRRLSSIPSRSAEAGGATHDAELDRLRAEIARAAERSEPRDHPGNQEDPPYTEAHRAWSELEAFRDAAWRWSRELERLHERQLGLSGPRAGAAGDREERLERALAEREAELRTLRSAAANRELDLQREHSAETQRQQEEIASLKKRLGEAESVSGAARDEELREVKRLAFERERDLRRAHAEKLSEAEKEAQRRVSALRAQREADNRSLIESHAAEKASREEELQSLRLRRNSEARAYGERIEELARERAEERTSLEEAVAKLREKHDSERARLQERIESLEEALDEQESISIALLGELGYLPGAHGAERASELSQASQTSGTTGEIELAYRRAPGERVLEALRGIRGSTAPGDLLREGIALFNETEHVKVVEAISKSLGEPEVHAVLEDHGSDIEMPVITLLWKDVGWRRYVAEPRTTDETKVYLAGYGEGDARPPLPASGPNARLDAQGLLSLGVRPL